MRTIICSKHPGLPEWIKHYHPDLYGSVWLGGEALVVDVVTGSMARGNRIIGSLAHDLRNQCPEYYQVVVPNISMMASLSCEELEQYGCFLLKWRGNI